MSTSSASSSSTLTHTSIICSLYCTYILFFLELAVNAEGFDSLVQSPHLRNPSRSKTKKMTFSVNDYGSQGDGVNDDTQPPHWRNSSRSKTKKVTFYVSNYGAKGDGVNDDTRAFKNVWKAACSFSSRSKVVILVRNTHLVQPVDFGGPCQSKLTLKISGTIVAPRDPDAWHGLNPQKWLYFHGVNHLTVGGKGVIDGRGQEWWARSCKIHKSNPCQRAPTALTFHRCKHVNVRDLVMVNSQKMHLAFTNCVFVVASHLRVLAPGWSPNTDGIHISSSAHVEVKDSNIRTGDDCISIVGNSSVIRIRRISCGPGHGISIGSLGKSNSYVQVHDVRVDGAFLSNTENGMRIKTWQGGSGLVSNIAFQNAWMKNVSNPIIINQYYCDSQVPCQNKSLAVKVEDISFMGIKGTSATEEAIKFACSDTFPCEGLYLEDIHLVLYSSGPVRSFCWEAQGSSAGLVLPQPCFSSCQGEICQKVLYSSILQSI
ncbi:probable polygalacturonase At1g80170 [Diospyros lotus]|uniref:probable polygalacturonase At1g80170 n=1 Tax=Diospyros lotus TaxID=55363 RepID=UPI00225BB124|nr:probable polygalacturonase At1g80170 [Diospyros lotus]